MSSEWRTYRLQEVGRLVTGKTPKSGVPAFDGDDVPFVSPPDFSGNKWIAKTVRSISEAGAESVKGSLIPPRSVLVTCIGSDMGKAAIAASRCVTNQQINAILVDESRFCPEFVYYNLSLRKDEIRSLAGGSAQPILNKSAFGQIFLEAPCLEVQRKVSAALRPLDDRITLLRETNATLEAIAQALFKSWFVDFDPVRAKMAGRAPEGMDEATAALFPDTLEETELGVVPKGWRVGKVSDLGDVVCGKTPPTSCAENYGGDVPFITIPDMHGLLAVTETARSLSCQGADSQAKKYLPAGAVCVSCIATPGLVVQVTTPSQTNQQINSVIPFDLWGEAFPLFLLRRVGGAVRMGGSGGSVFHNLSKSGFEAISVLLPSPALAQAFNDYVEPLIKRIVENQRQVKVLSVLRDTLLPRLISGQLRLTDNACESATN